MSSENHFEPKTKAEVLNKLSGLITMAEIPPLFYFSCRQWNESKYQVLETIKGTFRKNLVAVRSSCKAEDTANNSMAGAFDSVLSVDCENTQELESAINKVLESFDADFENQILIQHMVTEVTVSGVITTRVLDDGAPYYVINYDDESGKTDTVTGGTGVHKCVFIHHLAPQEMIESPRLSRWLKAVKELETIYKSIPLDIEFAESKDGKLHILQVRPLATHKLWDNKVPGLISDVQKYIVDFLNNRRKKRSSVLGNNLILGEMPDWNPAEMIGTTPRPLAVSFYRYLITDEIWRTSRQVMGYKHPLNETLMVVLGGRPYIDVRNSFNSFLPGSLDPVLGEKLVDAWLARLNENPHLHDKVEFDIAQTVIDFQFQENFKTRYGHLFTDEEFKIFKKHLTELTKNNLNISQTGSLKQALQQIDKLAENQQSRENNFSSKSSIELIDNLVHLVRECQQIGTFPFAVIARHAFIAESLLQTAVARGALDEVRLLEFKRSLRTVTSEMATDFAKAFKEVHLRSSFMKKYGHLRPGTYDLLSSRYDQRNDIFALNAHANQSSHTASFELHDSERKIINSLLQESELSHLDAQEFFEYCSLAIKGREYAKFIFTRNLSDALEVVATWGSRIGLDREDLSYISVHQIIETLTNPIMSDERDYFKEISLKNKGQMHITKSLHLGYIIRDERDLFVIPLHRSAPNFITRNKIEAEKIILDSHHTANLDLRKKIVCIENADPGYDWIFTRDIAGLVTKFGGKNSHMSIRCAELNLPAAIGCGEYSFERLKKSSKILLDCSNKKVEPLF